MKSKPQTMQTASDALSYSQLINFLSLLPSFLYKLSHSKNFKTLFEQNPM